MRNGKNSKKPSLSTFLQYFDKTQLAKRRSSIARSFIFVIIFASLGAYLIHWSSAVSDPTANCSTTNLVWVSPNGSDSNPGTQAQPWLTFYHTAQSIQPGQTALFMDGIYNETQLARVFTTGTATSPVCFEAQHAGQATLSYSLGAGVETTIMLYAPYQYFLNFHIYVANYDPAKQYVYGIQTWFPCHHCLISGNQITFNPAVSGYPIGIKPNGDFTTITGNFIENGVDSVDA